MQSKTNQFIVKMPITVGSRLHAWRRAASPFTEYGLVVAAEAPFGKFMVAPVAKFMGEVKVRSNT